MYKVSSAFRATIKGKSRTDKISGKITLTNGVVIPFVDADVKSDSLKIDNQCVNGDELEFGAVYAAQLVFTIKTDTNRYALYNAKVVFEYSLLLPTGKWESVPMGVYYITEAVRQGVYIKITALDSMIKLQTEFDGVATLGTPFQILTRFASKAGVPLGNTEAELNAMPNGTELFQIDATCNCTTWVDAVAIIAQMLGAFATATRDGGFALYQFHKTSDLEVIPDQRFETSISDYQSEYFGIKITDSSGNVYESYSENTDGLIMEIDDNPLFDVGLYDHKQELADSIREELCKIIYTPSDISCVADPTIECGDGITYDVNGDSIFSVITSYVWQYRGEEKLKAVGKNPYLTNAKNRAQKATTGLRQQVNESKIVFESFTNVEEYTVEQEEKRIISMTITATAKSNSVFFAQILVRITPDEMALVKSGDDSDGNTLVFNYSKDKPCQLTFVYYINGVEVEEYHPIDHFDAGDHIIALHYPLPDMEKNSTNRLIVTALADSGSAHIDIAQIKATVIGNGLAAGGVWDGTIEIMESLPLFNVESGFEFNNFTETVLQEQQIPIPTGIAENAHLFEFADNRIEINGVDDSVSTVLKTK